MKRACARWFGSAFIAATSRFRSMPSRAPPPTIQVNQELVKAYMRAAEALRQETRAAADVDVVALLRLPGVISGSGVVAPQNEESQELLGRALEDCLRDALAKAG